MHTESIQGLFGMKVTYRFEPREGHTHAACLVQGDLVNLNSVMES
jgi:hypothetical protein